MQMNKKNFAQIVRKYQCFLFQKKITTSEIRMLQTHCENPKIMFEKCCKNILEEWQKMFKNGARILEKYCKDDGNKSSNFLIVRNIFEMLQKHTYCKSVLNTI